MKVDGIILVNKDYADVLTVEEDDGSILDESIGGSELQQKPILVETPEKAQEEQSRE